MCSYHVLFISCVHIMCSHPVNKVYPHRLLLTHFPIHHPLLFIRQQLANWVRGLREKKALNLTKGIDVEVVEEGKQARAKTLTAERVERLNALGFVWAPAGPKAKWEDRFKELVDYYDTNGKWPSQSHGTLGEWVHKQRQAYNKNEPKYMATKAVKVRFYIVCVRIYCCLYMYV